MVVLGLTACGAIACGSGAGNSADDDSGGGGAQTPTARQYLLERVGEAAVVQLYADGFDRRVVYRLFDQLVGMAGVDADQPAVAAQQFPGVAQFAFRIARRRQPHFRTGRGQPRH